MKPLIAALAAIIMMAGSAAPSKDATSEESLCECIPSGPISHRKAVKNAYKKSGVVFYGRVIKASYTDSPDRFLQEAEFTFEVIESWKGVSTETFRVRSSIGGASCGVAYPLGSKALVFTGLKNGETNLGSVGSCGGLSVYVIPHRKRDHLSMLRKIYKGRRWK